MCLGGENFYKQEFPRVRDYVNLSPVEYSYKHYVVMNTPAGTGGI